MVEIKKAAKEIELVFRKYHLDYLQSKDAIKLARKGASLKAPKRQKGSVERLLAEEEARFIETAYQKGGARGLMLMTLLETATRVNEFVNLRIEDISFFECVIVIPDGKGSKRREIPMRRDLAQMIQIFIGDRDSGYLFQSRQDNRFSTRRIQQIVQETAAEANIHKHITPHKLRHTMATKLRNLGMPLDDIAKLLGHSDVGTTQIYARTETATVKRSFHQAMNGTNGRHH